MTSTLAALPAPAVLHARGRTDTGALSAMWLQVADTSVGDGTVGDDLLLPVIAGVMLVTFAALAIGLTLGRRAPRRRRRRPRQGMFDTAAVAPGPAGDTGGTDAPIGIASDAGSAGDDEADDDESGDDEARDDEAGDDEPGDDEPGDDEDGSVGDQG